MTHAETTSVTLSSSTAHNLCHCAISLLLSETISRASQSLKHCFTFHTKYGRDSGIYCRDPHSSMKSRKRSGTVEKVRTECCRSSFRTTHAGWVCRTDGCTRARKGRLDLSVQAESQRPRRRRSVTGTSCPTRSRRSGKQTSRRQYAEHL